MPLLKHHRTQSRIQTHTFSFVFSSLASPVILQKFRLLNYKVIIAVFFLIQTLKGLFIMAKTSWWLDDKVQFKFFWSLTFIVQSTNLCIFLLSVAVAAYQWLVCFLHSESEERLNEQLKKTSCSFTSRNNSQVYYCRSLALAYIEVRLLFLTACNGMVDIGQYA